MRKTPYATVLSMLISFAVASVAPAQTLADPSVEWRVGIAAFTGERLRRENGYLLSSIPLLIRDVLSGLDHHYLDEGERAARARRVVDSRVREARKRLGELYVTYDRLFLTDAGAQRAATAQRIDEARKALDDLAVTSPEAVAVPASKAVVFVDAPEGMLLAEVRTDPRNRAGIERLDLLIYGSVEQVDEYLFVELLVYDAARERLDRYTTAGSRETISERVEELGTTLISTVYGREWGGIDIRAAEESSRLRLDGDYLGTGSKRVRVVAAGPHTLMVRTPGFEDAAYEFEVRSGETRSVAANPGRRIESLVEIESTPSGATTYVGSVHRGTTPLTTQPPLEQTQLKLIRSGYNDYQLPIGPRETFLAPIELVPDTVDEQNLIRSRRSRFYRSLGMFALSVPLPMFLLDVTNELTSAYNRSVSGISSVDTLNVLWERRHAALSGYVGGMFLAGALFINLIVDLLEYIDVVGLSTG